MWVTSLLFFHNAMNDKEIFERIREGDLQAFGLNYERFKKEFAPFFKQHYRSTTEAIDDLFHESSEIFLNNVRKGKVEHITSITAYLVGVGKNIMKTRVKSPGYFLKEFDQGAAERYESLVGDEVDPEDFERKVKLTELYLDQLGEPCKTIIMLSSVSDMSMEEIGKLTGHKNADSVKTQKYKCLKRLKEIIKKAQVQIP